MGNARREGEGKEHATSERGEGGNAARGRCPSDAVCVRMQRPCEGFYDALMNVFPVMVFFSFFSSGFSTFALLSILSSDTTLALMREWK